MRLIAIITVFAGVVLQPAGQVAPRGEAPQPEAAGRQQQPPPSHAHITTTSSAPQPSDQGHHWPPVRGDTGDTVLCATFMMPFRLLF